MDTKITRTTIEDLVKYLQDSRNGYRESAANVDSQSIKNLFIMFSEKRERMLGELESMCADKEMFQSNGTLKGAIHQIFVNLKGFLTNKNVSSIIAEIKKGENFLIDSYAAALENDEVPVNLKLILRKQMQEIKNDLENVSEKAFDFT
jgi:uncharacterized protein (TIGR02284 family)